MEYHSNRNRLQLAVRSRTTFISWTAFFQRYESVRQAFGWWYSHIGKTMCEKEKGIIAFVCTQATYIRFNEWYSLAECLLNTFVPSNERSSTNKTCSWMKRELHLLIDHMYQLVYHMHLLIQTKYSTYFIYFNKLRTYNWFQFCSIIASRKSNIE